MNNDKIYLAAHNNGVIICENCAPDNIAQCLKQIPRPRTIISFDDNYDVMNDLEVKDLKKLFPNLCSCDKK